MQKVYLIRHAMPDIPLGERWCLGHTDIPLGTVGRMQAALLPYVPELCGKPVFCSYLSRALETARPLCPEPMVRDGLEEQNMGIWDGLSFREIQQRFPELYAAREKNPNQWPDDAETMEHVRQRMLASVPRCLQEFDGDIVIVSHKSAIDSLTGQRPKLLHTSISILDWEDDFYQVEEVGRVPHPALTEEICLALHRAAGTTMHVVAHCRAVAEEALRLAELLPEERSLDRSLLFSAAFLHDIARSQPNHAATGAAWIRALGYPETADVIAQHHDFAGNELNEAAVLYLADKYIRGEQRVTLEERFSESEKKCVSEEAREAHARRYTAAKQLESLFDRRYNMSNFYSDILNQIIQVKPVTVETVIQGESGEIASGLNRRLISGVTPVVDLKGRGFARVTADYEGDTLTVREPVMPQERLLVLGGGHIALPVCEFGAKCGFEVHVVDDRPDFANRRRFPDAKEVICDSFENGIRKFGVTPFDYVVVITRGHRHDADCLRVLLPGEMPAYLGMIGSRRRTKGLLEMLKEEGFDPERLAKICTPIGLDIGAITPAEIAVSILSEVIAYKRKPEHGAAGRCCSDSDLELSTLAYLAENHEPKAIVTVIETKGSTPRGTGAKMSVSPLAKVTGSIGGGCSEAAVIQDAVRIIGTGRYQLFDIDLTGEVAESDGMVCGGTMRVLIEDGSETR